MKKFYKEIILLFIQIFMFFISPLFAGPTDVMGMVFLIFIMTFILSFIMGCFSKEKIKYFYPIIVSILFIPSIFIYYNDSAFVHSIWYMFDSIIGLVLGSIVRKIFVR